MRNATRRERVERGIYSRRNAAGKTVYEIVYRDSAGKQRWETIEGGIRAARARRDDIAGRKGRGEHVRPNPRLRFGDAADLYWTAKATRLRPATQSAYGASLAHLRARWNNARLDDITVVDVARFVADMQRRGYAGWTIKGMLTVLGLVFNYASRHLGWHGVNPVTSLDRDERPRSDDRERRILSGDELHRLLEAVEPEYRALFAFAAATGARLGEVLGVRWHAIESEAGTVHFSHQLDRRGEYAPLKTKRSRRTIEIPPSLVSELRAHKLASPYSGDHDYVFCTRAGTGHDHRNIGGRVLARAVKRADLGPERKDGQVVRRAPTFHSLRHSHGSALIAAGWDLEEVSARLGHRDVTVTAQIYIHAYESAKRSAARRDRLEAMYGNGVRAADGSEQQDGEADTTGDVLSLSGGRSAAQ